MKVSGFSICRNAVKFDYPIVEAIRSALPVVDEFVVNVGQSNDGTVGVDPIHWFGKGSNRRKRVGRFDEERRAPVFA